MTQIRLTAEERKAEFIEVGIKFAEKNHYLTVRAQDVVDKLRVSNGLLQNYFSNIDTFRKAVLRKAVKDGNLKIIAQAMGASDPLVKRAPGYLKEAALEGVKANYGL